MRSLKAVICGRHCWRLSRAQWTVVGKSGATLHGDLEVWGTARICKILDATNMSQLESLSGGVDDMA